MLRAVIVEDEPIARRQLRDLLADVDWIDCVGEAADGLTAVSLIDELAPDLVFLDIEMPELNGLGVLGRIAHEPAVVFTTAYDKFAVAAFELDAVDYLLKPFGRDRFRAALERVRRSLSAAANGNHADGGGRDDVPLAARAREAIDHLAGSAPRQPLTRIFVRDRGRIVPVAVSDIERLDADDDYVAVHSRGRRFLVYLGMAEFEARLPAERFVRIHRSHIVNLDFVAALEPYDATRLEVRMADGTRIVASRTRSRELRGLAI
jgi:two-component system, LytTR family, response regulator